MTDLRHSVALTLPRGHTRAMPTSPPPQGPPPGWQPQRPPWPPQPPQQLPPQFGIQPPPGHVIPPQFRKPGEWWYDGRKWRPPVGAQPTRWELISQVPGMLIKLTFLIIALAIIVTLLL